MNTQNSLPPKNTLRHLSCLDGIRGLAILSVMLHHFWTLPILPLNYQIYEISDPLDNFLTSFFKSGWLGVDLFFVLSGFLITSILIQKKSEEHYFKNFYARRALRIFPLYYLFLGFMIFLIPQLLTGTALLINPQHILPPERVSTFFLYISNLDFALNEAFARSPSLTVTWSLAIEEQFYLFWPLVVYFLSKKNLFRTCLAISLFSFFLRLWLLNQNISWIPVYVFTLTRIDTLAFGALAAILFANKKTDSSSRLNLLIMCLSGIGIVSQFLMHNGLSVGQPQIQLFGYSLFGIFSASLIFKSAVQERSWLSRTLSLASLRTLGKYSYALYLLHVPVLTLAVGPLVMRWQIYLWEVPHWVIKCFIVCLSFPISLILAFLSWNLIEKHFLNLKKYF